MLLRNQDREEEEDTLVRDGGWHSKRLQALKEEEGEGEFICFLPFPPLSPLPGSNSRRDLFAKRRFQHSLEGIVDSPGKFCNLENKKRSY